MCAIDVQAPGGVGNANQMPAIRCATYTGAFDEVFEAYRQEVEQSPVKSARKQ